MFNIHPILYYPNETEFVTGGIGSLAPRSCIVTEVRNGEYELEMDIDSSSPFFDRLKIGRIILAPHFPEVHEYMDYDDWEPFEIVDIDHDLTHIAHVRAWHISYRTSKVCVMPFSIHDGHVSPFNVWNAMDAYPTNHGFGIDDRTTTENEFDDLTDVISLRSLIGGEENSIVSLFDAEIEWNRFSVIVHDKGARGKESGVMLKYGQNITGLTRQQTAEDVYSGIVPFWKSPEPDELTGEYVIVTLPEKGVYVNNALRDYYSSYLYIPLNMTDQMGAGSVPTVSELRTAAQAFIDRYAYRNIPENIDVSFTENPELANDGVKYLKLCDTLTVEYEDMGLSYTAMVTKTVYNVLLNRYDEISISTEPVTLNKAIKQVVRK